VWRDIIVSMEELSNIFSFQRLTPSFLRLDRIKNIVNTRFDIEHTTIEFD
jgi:hypothetical protein